MLNHANCVIHKGGRILETVIDQTKLTTLLGRGKCDHVWEELSDGSMPILAIGPTQIYLQRSVGKGKEACTTGEELMGIHKGPMGIGADS